MACFLSFFLQSRVRCRSDLFLYPSTLPCTLPLLPPRPFSTASHSPSACILPKHLSVLTLSFSHNNIPRSSAIFSWSNTFSALLTHLLTTPALHLPLPPSNLRKGLGFPLNPACMHIQHCKSSDVARKAHIGITDCLHYAIIRKSAHALSGLSVVLRRLLPYCKVSTCAALGSSCFWYPSHALATHLTCLTYLTRLAPCSCYPRASVRSTQDPLPSLACQRYLLLHLFLCFFETHLVSCFIE